MSKLKHTQGPWTFTDIIRDQHGNAICRIIFGDSALANAQLIAAAPELLEALKQAVSACPCSFRERDSGHRTDCCAPNWLQVIKKAEGR